MKIKNKKHDFYNNVKKTFNYMKDSKIYLISYAFVSVIESILGVVLPIISAKIILNMTNELFEQLIYTSIIVFLLEAAQYIMSYFKSLFFRKIYRRTLINFQIKVAEETLKLEISEIDKESSGLFIDRLNRDTQEISSMFMEYAYWTSYVITNIGVLVTVFILNKYLFVFAIITSICIFIINKKRLSKQYEVQKKYKKLQEKKTGLTSEIVRGIRDIKVLNARNNVLNQTKEKIEEVTKEELKFQKINSTYMYYERNTRAFFDLIFLIFGCILCENNLLNVPTFIIVYNYQNKIKNLLLGVSNLLEYNKKFEVASNRVFEIIDDDRFKKEQFGTKKVEKIDGNIEFKNVSFSYNSKHKILDDMNFKINPNEKIAFVGKSGAGKTTIFNLIAKLYHPNSGSIFLDGVDINDLTCDSIRNNISIITQSPYIFNFSIKENLLLAKKDATMKEIREACKLACIDDFIMKLPKKYNTMIGENGVILSGGQKQRLAIARALLMKTEIILFDEATSALDNETQKEISMAIDNLKGEYTILIVAHRLSTVIDCDRIFVVDNGRIVDVGNHKELMKKSKIYKGLYNNEI